MRHDFVLQRFHGGKCVPVDFQQLVNSDSVFGRIEIGGVGQEETKGVADAAIRFGDTF